MVRDIFYVLPFLSPNENEGKFEMAFENWFNFGTFEKIPIGNDGWIRIQSSLSNIPVFIHGVSIFALKNWRRRIIHLTFSLHFI
jgi:hypothetical protein